MKWWRFSALLMLAAAIGVSGCGSSPSSGVSITISPTIASVITNTTQQFSGLVTGNSNTAITWSLTCATGVTSCGTIDAAGLYSAPTTIPTTTSGTTTTPAPAVTIKGTAQADTSKTATATLTIVTGISITITPTTATVGTGENFLFTATVSNPGCNLTSNPTCQNVTWSVPTSTTTPNPNGAIGSTTGVYTAPTTVPSPSTVIITATSVADTSVTATASVLIVTASDPTVTSVSPNITAKGGLFQDVYITGTNFISTNIVYVSGTQLAPALVAQVSSSLIRARIPDFILASPPTAPGSNSVLIGVSKQTGSKISCSGSDQTPCEIAFMNARPGLVGPTPVSIPQGTTGVQSFDVDGGFFGTGGNPAVPAVTATFNGQLRGIQLPASQTIGSTRQLKVTIGGTNSTDFTVPGLYPVAVQNATDSSKFAVANLAVQPNYSSGSSLTDVKDLTSSDGIRTTPSAVAIDSALGIAVVANTGSNDVTLIDLTATSGPTVIASLCTFAPGLADTCPNTSSGPTSVAVDDVLHEALVVNATSKSIAVVDLAGRSVTSVIQLQDTPEGVGINPVTDRALVAMQQTNYGVLVNLNPTPDPQNPDLSAPGVAGIVSISTGKNTNVAVEPHLNWALATPGGAGSLGIVDLNAQSRNAITAVSRTTNVVTVTVQSTVSAPPLSVVAGDTVWIKDVAFPASAGSTITALAPTFDGFYTVSSTGPGPNQFSYSQTGATQTDVATQSTPQATSNGLVRYSQPVASVGLSINAEGIAINPETQQAVLVDPTTGLATFFSLIDQTTTSTSSLTPNIGVSAAAYNPLTNAVVTVNSNILSVIDPVTQATLTSKATRPGAVAVAIDPGTNTAIVANQTDNSVSIFNLGPIQPFSITDSSPKTFVSNSTLGSGPSPSPLTLTVVGTGLTCGATIKVRLDGAPLLTSCVGSSNRELTATVPASMLASARRFALDVFDSGTGQVTNSEDFTVVQSVDVTGCSLNPTGPQPSGVAIDPVQNLAAVSLFGCNSLALINMSTGTGTAVTVGANPIGVAVLPRLHLAAVANNGPSAGSASIVDELQQSVTQTVTTGSGSIGVAADEATGEFAIANSLANTVTVVNAQNGGSSTISTGQRPIAVAFNYINSQVAAAATGGNDLGISGGSTGLANQTFSVQAPTSVVYDPVFTDCGSISNGTTTNTTGCFIVASSTNNSVQIIDPVTSAQTSFRMGINPTAIAYNFRTSTLVSTNAGSQTLTVADLLGRSVRAVLSLSLGASTNSNLALNLAASGALQYAIDIDPFTNIAVIADTANGRVLFVPLPH